MTALHIVNKSAFSATALTSCLEHMPADASLLLIEDGIYSLCADAPAARLQSLAAASRLYLLAPHMASRGVAGESLMPGVRLVDYTGFVDLVAGHSPIQSWF